MVPLVSSEISRLLFFCSFMQSNFIMISMQSIFSEMLTTHPVSCHQWRDTPWLGWILSLLCFFKILAMQNKTTCRFLGQWDSIFILSWTSAVSIHQPFSNNKLKLSNSGISRKMKCIAHPLTWVTNVSNFNISSTNERSYRVDTCCLITDR